MDFLTSTILSGIAWDVIKEGTKLTKSYLQEHLRNWVLRDQEYEVIVNTINNASDQDTKSIKYLDAYIDSNDEIKKILETVNNNSKYSHCNNTYNHSVDASGNQGTQTITINNGVNVEPKK